MKVLIWIGTFTIGSILNMMIGQAIGFRAGAILLYLAEYFFAKKMCEKWDERQNDKNDSDMKNKD